MRAGQDVAYGSDYFFDIAARHGFGAVMACASSQWMEALTRQGYPLEGAHVSGPCVGTVTDTIDLINRALSA